MKNFTKYIFIDCGFHKGESTNKFKLSPAYYMKDWYIYAFEPNPNLQTPDFVDKRAVWVDDKGIDFFEAKLSESSTVFSNKTTGGVSDIPIKVPSVDFSKWLLENFSYTDFIVLHMNIEGAEYKVLNKMLNDGSICLIKFLYLEFHNTKIGLSVECDRVLLNKIRLADIPVVESSI